MTSSLTFQNRIVAEARIQGLHGRPTVGGYRLAFSLELSAISWRQLEQAVVLENWQACVSCGPKGGTMQVLADALPEVPQILKTFEFENRTHVLFFVDLTPGQLAALEEVRNGGDLSFKFSLSTVCTGQTLVHATNWDKADKTTPSTSEVDRQVTVATITYDTNLGEWAKVLNELGYAKLMVFSVTLPLTDVSGKLGEAQRMLDKAQSQFIHGRYEDVVAVTRKLMESVREALSEGDALATSIKKFKDGGAAKESMTKLERSLFVQEAVRHYAHPSHHVEKNSGSDEWYSRSDAAFMMAMASAVLAEAVARNA